MWISVNWVLHGTFLFDIIILKITCFRFSFVPDAEWRINFLMSFISTIELIWRVIRFQVTSLYLYILKRNLKCGHAFKKRKTLWCQKWKLCILKLIENALNSKYKNLQYIYIFYCKPSLYFWPIEGLLSSLQEWAFMLLEALGMPLRV